MPLRPVGHQAVLRRHSQGGGVPGAERWVGLDLLVVAGRGLARLRDRFGYRDEWLRPDPEDVDRVLEEMGEEPGQEEAEEEGAHGTTPFPEVV